MAQSQSFKLYPVNLEDYHQNQNLAERRGGDLKTATIKLFHKTPHAPIRYWCYALEYITYVRQYLSHLL